MIKTGLARKLCVSSAVAVSLLFSPATQAFAGSSESSSGAASSSSEYWTFSGSDVKYAPPGTDPQVAQQQGMTVLSETSILVDGPGSADTVSDVPTIPPGAEVEERCPTDSIHSGAQDIYTCLHSYRDPLSSLVLIRQGRSGSSGFGELHALIDHNLDYGTAGNIINHAYPVAIASRNEYQADFHDTNGNTTIRAFVRVDVSRSNQQPANDPHMFGLVTGYCKTGPEAGEGLCPDWVNATL